MGVRESPLKIEPCLFEWTGWYGDGIPTWVTTEELNAGGYNTDLTYHPHFEPEDLEVNETVDRYYNRSFEFVNNIVTSTGKSLNYDEKLYYSVQKNVIHFQKKTSYLSPTVHH